LLLATLAVFNMAGLNAARVFTWILQPILFLVGGVVTAGQVFAEPQVRNAWARSGDSQLARVDVARMMGAAVGTFPRCFRGLVVTRFVLTTVGSVLVVVLLSLPVSSEHFRS
jgi:hypothetical protein